MFNSQVEEFFGDVRCAGMELFHWIVILTQFSGEGASEQS